jgi:Bax protein
MSKVSKFIGTIKGKLIIVVIAVVALASAFATGTFHPNTYTLDKLVYKIENVLLERAKKLGLHEPDFKYNSPESFTQAVSDCVDYLNFTVHHDERIPKGLIIAMAGIESGWGTSRFAEEGNNLFGIRTWDPKVPQLKPLDLPNARFGVRTYPTKCQSVQDAIDILNRHPAYADFRVEREKQSEWVETWNYELLVPHIAPWSTNELYSAIILDTINARQLP